MGELIAVLSGKGGTGKTTVCAGIATALAVTGSKVLCIDCDVGLRNLDISLGMSGSDALSFVEVAEGGYSLSSAAENPWYRGLFFLTAPVSASASDVDAKAFSSLLQKAKKQFDYVLLDAPAGIEAGFTLAASQADRILLVTGADPGAMRDAGRTGEKLERMGKTDVRLIVNRVHKKMIRTMHLNIDDVMDDTGLPLIGVVPEDPKVTLAAHFDRPVLLYAPRRKGATAAFYSIARRIEGIPTPISIR